MAAADKEPHASAVRPRSYQDESYLHGFLETVGDLQNDGAFQDIILEVEGRRFPCHRLVLSAASPYFRAMFTSDMAESRQKTVVLQGLNSGMFGEILSYIYSGTLHVSLDKVQPLYQAADLLQLVYVRDTCSSYMVENVKVESSTCVDLYKFADVFSQAIVLKRCQQWIVRHFTEVASSEEFCSLSVNQLTEIISHDELDVKEETTVWEAVVRWVQHSREDRQCHLPSILPHIRFNLLTSDDTAAILEHPLVREDPGSSEVIRNVVQKGNSNLKPRFGMTTEMALLSTESWSNHVLAINPEAGSFYEIGHVDVDDDDVDDDDDDERYLNQVLAKAVTSDNDIYVLTEASTLAEFEEEKFSLYKYNEVGNRFEQKSSVRRLRGDGRPRVEHLVEAGGDLYYLNRLVDRSSGREYVTMEMIRYNRHTDQWHSCPQLYLKGRYEHDNRYGGIIKKYMVVSCGQQIYVFSSAEMHRYDPSQERWSWLTIPRHSPEFCTAVTMGTEIFCAAPGFSKMMIYNTEADSWQELPVLGQIDEEGLLDSKYPRFFVLGDKLHVMFSYREGMSGSPTSLVCVYDRSTATWSDLRLPKALPTEVGQCVSPFPVARMYLPYFKADQIMYT
ncbi:kelch-like protein 12 isoform X1 [Branchiostoma lanceolatum]|uniref:kelch-like protein 12 isoform X1 n=1 Tax=Branchiostoma lanceolatum TaxID=7740 RepID=UPI003456F799